MALTPSVAKSTGASGKYKSYTSKSKAKSSYKNVQAATGQLKAGSSYTTEEGVKVTTQNKTSYANVQAERDKLIQEAAASGTATTQQASEANKPKVQQVTIAIDKIAVKDYNETLARQGIYNAEDYFKAVRAADQAKQPVSQDVNYRPVAPKVARLDSESSQPYSEGTQPVYNEPYSIQDYPGYKKPDNSKAYVKEPEKPWYDKIDENLAAQQEARKQAREGQPKVLKAAGAATDTIVYTALGATKGVFITGPKAATLGTKKLVTDVYTGKTKFEDVPYIVVKDTATGLYTEAQRGSVALLTGDLPEAAEVAGEFYSFKLMGDATNKVVSPVVADLKQVPGSVERVRRQVAFEDARGSTPTDFNYKFSSTSYDLEGRQRVYVPEEYKEARGQRQLTPEQKEAILSNPQILQLLDKETIANIYLDQTKAPELQTQLYSTTKYYDSNFNPNIEAPIPPENNLQALSDAGFSNTARQLALETKRPSPTYTAPRIPNPRETQAVFNIRPSSGQIIESWEPYRWQAYPPLRDWNPAPEIRRIELARQAANYRIQNPPSSVQKGPVENPSFRFQNPNIEIKPPEEFLYIPTEYTELGKSISKTETKLPADASQGEMLPGTYLEAFQPKSVIEKEFYKKPENIPPELQTRLSTEKKIPQTRTLTNEELLNQNKKSSEQKKITSFDSNVAPPSKDYFNSQKYRLKNLQEELDKLRENKKGQNSISLNTPKANFVASQIYRKTPVEYRDVDALRGKYLTYKNGNLEIRDVKEITLQNPANINYIKSTSTLIGGDQSLSTSKAYTSNYPVPPIIIRITQDQTIADTRPITSAGTPRTDLRSIPDAQIKYKQLSESATDLAINEDIASQQGTGGSSRTRIKSISSTIQTSNIIQQQEQDQAQEQTPIIRTITDTRPITRPRPFNPSSLKVPEPPEEINTLFRPSSTEEEPKGFGSFNLEVRQQGVFKPVKTGFKSIEEAQRQGNNIIENTAAASYRITSRGSVQNVRVPAGFIRSKRQRGVIVEPVSRRINQPAEKSAIPFSPVKRFKKKGKFF